jgi:hypothetical protein
MVAHAPQPPWPLSLALNTAPVSMRLPAKLNDEKVPKCAPVTRSGKAGSSALMMQSITVGNGMLYNPIAAVASALINLPSGRIILTGLNVPSLAGSSVAIRYLNATRTQVRPPP